MGGEGGNRSLRYALGRLCSGAISARRTMRLSVLDRTTSSSCNGRWSAASSKAMDWCVRMCVVSSAGQVAVGSSGACRSSVVTDRRHSGDFPAMRHPRTQCSGLGQRNQRSTSPYCSGAPACGSAGCSPNAAPLGYLQYLPPKLRLHQGLAARSYCNERLSLIHDAGTHAYYVQYAQGGPRPCLEASRFRRGCPAQDLTLPRLTCASRNLLFQRTHRNQYQRTELYSVHSSP